jgi:hypothetical protein
MEGVKCNLCKISLDEAITLILKIVAFVRIVMRKRFVLIVVIATYY